MWPFNKKRRQSSGSSVRRNWAEKVKEIIENKARSEYPRYRIDVNMIGIEPPHVAEREWSLAEKFVKGLEKHKNFDEICFRVFVGFLDEKTNQLEFAKHIEIKEGKVGAFFWPPHEDWESTPIIYSRGHYIESGVTTP